MDFKSKANYQKWLGFGHASGLFASTPGNQPVSIKGKPKTVKHADGGPLNNSIVSNTDIPNGNIGMEGLMKSTIAREAAFGNPSALRMVSPNPKTYDFGNGNLGTHYMASMGNYAVPLLQDKGGNELEYNENPPVSKEDIKFRTPEEAQYFAEHYKEVAPMMKQFATGGPLGDSNVPNQQLGQLTQFNAGGTHNENENGGINQGMNPNGQQNMVEQGETKLNSKNYIFSNSLKIDKDTAKEFYFPSKYIGKTFADVSKLMERPNSKRTNDSIEENAKKKELDSLMNAQEIFKQRELSNDLNNMMVKHPDFMQSMMDNSQPMNPQMEQQLPVQGEQVPMESPMAKYGGYQNKMNFGGDLLNVGKNTGLGIADTALSMVGANNVISDDMYRGAGSELASGFSDKAGQIGKFVLPIAANAVIPGSGMAVRGLQQVGSQLNPEEEQQQVPGMIPPFVQRKTGGYLNKMQTGGVIPSAATLNYIKNNPYNTTGVLPMSNSYSPNVSNITLDPISGQSNTPEGLYNVPQWTPEDSFASMNMVNQSREFSDEEVQDLTDEPMVQDENGNWVKDTKGIYDVPKIPGEQDELTGYNVEQTPLNALGTYAPVAYNVGMGLFGKVDKLDPDSYINNAKLNNWRTNINPQLKSVDEAYAAASAGLRNSGAGGGAYLANMQGLAGQQGMNKASIYAGAENDYNARQLQIDQINAARGDQNAQMRLQIAQYNAQAKAAKQKTLQEGIGQLGQISQSDTQNKLAATYNNLLAPDYANFARYTNYLESLKNSKTE